MMKQLIKVFCVGDEDGEDTDRVKATKMWEKMQLVWTLWSCSGSYKSTATIIQLLSQYNCLCHPWRPFQLQAHELEV